jgi:hypothetical protein
LYFVKHNSSGVPVDNGTQPHIRYKTLNETKPKELFAYSSSFVLELKFAGGKNMKKPFVPLTRVGLPLIETCYVQLFSQYKYRRTGWPGHTDLNLRQMSNVECRLNMENNHDKLKFETNI